MKWLDKIIVDKASKIVEQSHQKAHNRAAIKELTLNAISIGGAKSPYPDVGGRLDAQPDLSFRMFKAENGFVMQVHSTDRKTERQHVNLHIISDDQDLGQAIGHIITLESLKV